MTAVGKYDDATDVFRPWHGQTLWARKVRSAQLHRIWSGILMCWWIGLLLCNPGCPAVISISVRWPARCWGCGHRQSSAKQLPRVRPPNEPKLRKWFTHTDICIFTGGTDVLLTCIRVLSQGLSESARDKTGCRKDNLQAITPSVLH